VLEAIDAGNLITAIKHYRDHTRCSLKEAKEACEAIAERRGRR
jgi:ribosomal protein L7/L12